MSPMTQSWLQVAVLLLGIGATMAGAIVYQTHYIDKRIEGLDKRIEGLDKRIDDVKDDVVARIEALEKRLVEKIEALGKRLEDRIERLEHPVARPQ